MTLSFRDAIQFLKPFAGKDRCYLYVKDCERAFSKVTPDDRESLFEYILSQLEGVDPDSFANRSFQNWEELKNYLNGSFINSAHPNICNEIAKFTTLKQGSSEDVHSYYNRAYNFKRRIDTIKPQNGQYQMLHLANIELIRCFVSGLRDDQFRFTLCQKLPESLEEALNTIELWQCIPGFDNSSNCESMVNRNCNYVCPICNNNLHCLADCPRVWEAQRERYGNYPMFNLYWTPKGTFVHRNVRKECETVYQQNSNQRCYTDMQGLRNTYDGKTDNYGVKSVDDGAIFALNTNRTFIQGGERQPLNLKDEGHIEMEFNNENQEVKYVIGKNKNLRSRGPMTGPRRRYRKYGSKRVKASERDEANDLSRKRKRQRKRVPNLINDSIAKQIDIPVTRGHIIQAIVQKLKKPGAQGASAG